MVCVCVPTPTLLHTTTVSGRLLPCFCDCYSHAYHYFYYLVWLGRVGVVASVVVVVVTYYTTGMGVFQELVNILSWDELGMSFHETLSCLNWQYGQ